MGTTPEQVLPAARARPTLVARALVAVVIGGGEKLLLNQFVDFSSTQTATGMRGIVRVAQHVGFRFAVSFALALALFAFVRESQAFARANQQARHEPLRPRWLLAHALAVVGLVPITFLLFGEHAPHLPFLPLLAAWLLLALGALAALLAGLAPAALWWRAAEALGTLWLYAGLSALVASGAMYLSEALWQPTAGITFELVRQILTPLLPQLHADAATRVLSTGRFAVEIAEACSGLEGAGLMLAFCSAWLIFFRKEYYFPRALLLIPAGLVLIFALNVLRIAALVLIGHAGYPDIAVYGFHSQAGWIAFNCAAGGLAFASLKSPWFHRAPAHAGALETDNATAAYLVPFLAILAAGMLSRALSGHFEYTYPLRLLAALVALYLYRRKLMSLDWRCSWRGPAVGAAVALLWIGCAHVLLSRSGTPVALAELAPAARWGWILARVLGAVLTVPLAEELAYRGFLMRRLVSADFESVPYAAVGWLPLVATAVVFGMGHGALWPAGIAAGLAYGLLLTRTQRLGEPVAAHVTSNALIAAYVLAAQHWELW